VRGTGTQKTWGAAIALALAGTACLAVGMPTVAAGDGASASVANCQGKAFSPVHRNRKFISKGNIACTGDVATARLRVCLEQQVGFRFRTVECAKKVRHSPGGLFARVEHICRRSVERDFRTRAFLFLKDLNGQRARGKAISPTPVFPFRC
jgi:hypothetical protein